MSELKRIRVHADGRDADAILLAVYDRKYYHFQKTLAEKLLFRKTRSKMTTVTARMYLVFVPWKHRAKQLLEIGASDVISCTDAFPAGWITDPSFVSAANEPYYPSVTVENFSGYDFIRQNASMIADQICGNETNNLEIVYAEMPELLREEFDEESV